MRVTSVLALILGLSLSVSLPACSSGSTDYTQPAPSDGGSQDLAMTPVDLASADQTPAMCQLVPQAGCAAGNKCSTHDLVTTLCDPDGSVDRGQRCMVQNMIDNCFAGNACTNAGNSIGICRTFCRTDNDCGTRSFCELALGTGGIRVCTQACNALGATAGCPTGLSCYAYNNEHTDCRLTGTTAEAQPCVRSEDCRPGMACLGPAGAERCRVLCQRSNGSGCSLGQTCTAVTYSGGAQWPTYGACL